jgi:hypothetical protein
MFFLKGIIEKLNIVLFIMSYIRMFQSSHRSVVVKLAHDRG